MLELEATLEPERRIIDPHHHLWHWPGYGTYLLEDLWRDIEESGHRVEKTVFIECGAFYRKDDGPKDLRTLGETETVAEIAQRGRQDAAGRSLIAGIVAHVDLSYEPARLEEILELHRVRSGGLLRGVRHAGARDIVEPEVLSIKARGMERQYEREDFRRGLKLLGKLGLTYDTWHYHHQNKAFAELARAVPETTLVLDHFGTPLGVGRFSGRREEIYPQWCEDIAEIARCPNVIAKLGGLAMPDCGFGWDKRGVTASSDELLDAQRKYYMHALECFGPERCMFESNYPVDKVSVSYRALWNAFKRLAAGCSESEKHALFYGTAERVYGL